MRNNKSNIVRDIFTNLVKTVSGNMASNALLANVLYMMRFVGMINGI